MILKGNFQNQQVEISGEIIKSLEEEVHEYVFDDVEERLEASSLAGVRSFLGSINVEFKNRVYEIPVIVRVLKIKKRMGNEEEFYRKRLFILKEKIIESDNLLVNQLIDTFDDEAISNETEFEKIAGDILLDFIPQYNR